MDEQDDNQQVGSVPEPTSPGAGAPAAHADGEMPMLAGSAAARLTQQILSRLSSPFAVPSASPVRPGALWRQVSRRLGVAPQQQQRPGIGRPPASRESVQRQEGFAPEPPEMVWRPTIPGHQDQQQERVSPAESMARALRPSTRVVQPTQAPTPQEPPRFITNYTPTPDPTPATTAPAPAPATPQSTPEAVQPPTVPVQATAAQTPVSAPTPPTAPVAEIAQPAQPPAKVVAVEYVQGPAAMPVQPLVSHAPLVEEPSYYSPRNLADSLNRDLIPTTDMISRITRPSWEDMPMPVGRPSVPVATPQAAEQVPAAQPVQEPVQPAHVASTPTVVQTQASPVEEAPRLEMPLAATPTTPVTTHTTQREPARTVEEILEQVQRSPVRQLIDRVANTLPMPDAVRRFITGEPTPAERQPASIPVETTPRDTQGQATPPVPPTVTQESTGAPNHAQTSTSLPVQTSPAPAQSEAVTRAATTTQPVASATTSTSATSIPSATSAQATNPQPSTPGTTSATRTERASTGRASSDVVQAPAPEVTPPALEMPVRVAGTTSSSQAAPRPAELPATRIVQPQPHTQQPAPPAATSALGPFQAFQPTSQPQDQPQVSRQVQTAEVQQSPSQQQTQSVQAAQSEPFGPFQPFQPSQTPVAEPAQTPDAPAPTTLSASASTPSPTPTSVQTPQSVEQATPAAEPQPPTSQAPTPVQPISAQTATPPLANASQPEPRQAIEEVSPALTTELETVQQDAPAREVATVRTSEPRGFLGSIFDRFFGRGQTDSEDETAQEQPRTPAIQMPWVGRNRSPRTQQGEVRTPSEFELPATRIAEPPTRTSSQPTPTVSPQASTLPIASTPEPIAVQQTPATTSAPESQPQQPTLAVPEQTPVVASASTPTVSPEVVQQPVVVQPSADSAAADVSAGPTTSFSSAQDTPASLSEPRQVIEATSDAPDLPRVVSTTPSPGTPAPLDMPHASQATSQQSDMPVYEDVEDLLLRATLPVESVAPPVTSTPTAIETPTSFTSQPAPMPEPAPEVVTQAPEPAQAATPTPTAQPQTETQQAWSLMPDMADGLVRSHAPLSSVEPMETAVQGDLLARILGSLGNEIAAAGSESPDLPRAVPAPETGVGMDLPFARPSAPSIEPGVVAGPASTASSPTPAYMGEQPTQSRTASTGSLIPSVAPQPIGLPATPMITREQFMPDGLRDIRTSSNMPTVADSVARPVSSETTSVPGTPTPIAMPARYITNVTPATYMAEDALARAQTSGGATADSPVSPLSTIMRPASHMSPSMGNYGWPGDDGSAVTPSVMLPLSEMSPTVDSYMQAEAGQGEQASSLQAQSPQQYQGQDQETQAPWMAALQALYGQKSEPDDMPLAIPYGAFALPSEPSQSATTWQAPGFGTTPVESSQGRPASQGFSAPSMPIPTAPSYRSGYDSTSYSQPSPAASSSSSSWSSDSWSTEGLTEAPPFTSWSGESYSSSSYSDADSESGAWADVVASAVSGASDGSPALALAAEERGSSAPSSPAEPANTQDGGRGASSDLDELAESVLDIIRNKIVIERERNFG